MKLGVTTKKQKLARIFVKDSMLTLLTSLLNLFFKGGDNRYLTNLVERGKNYVFNYTPLFMSIPIRYY